ncbi:MAG: hypothetical protein Q7J57_11690 [Gemmobacter sp.]|nr:hypothetical protein [Gemmobacter sp.]
MTLPGVAASMKPWLPELVGALLFLAALRIGPRAAFGALADLPRTLTLALVYQLVLPLIAVAVALLGGWQATPLAMALVLMLSAPAISGSPNLTAMTGNDPTPALRLLILGTMLLPLTVLPVLWLLPQLGTLAEVAVASGRLLAVIAVSGGLGFAIRAWAMPAPGTRAIQAIDGLSAITMAIVVVALMSAVGPAIRHTPAAFAGWLAAAFVANFGLQIAAAAVLARGTLAPARVPFAIIAGNRNIALFLAALPAAVTDPILLFIGCYQIPMYLTPILLRRLFRAPAQDHPAPVETHQEHATPK